MPSSVTHLRVADGLLHLIDSDYAVDFTVGNIAPDCGVPIPGTKSYDPPRHVTHFTETPQRYNTKAHPEWFLSEYMKNADDTLRDYFFKIGYYVHLSVDTFYIEDVFERYAELYGDAFDVDMRRKIKRFDQAYFDMKFVAEHPEFAPSHLLFAIDGYSTRCLPYYAPDAISSRLADIKRLELTPSDVDVPESFMIAESDVDAFVDSCVDRLAHFVREMTKRRVSVGS